MICEILEDEGLEMIACDTARSALACILDELPDLVLLDVQMPMMDGIDVFLRMRADPVTASIPVIFLTANDHMVRARVPDYTARDAVLLPKPFDTAVLIALVKQQLSRILPGQD
jgi:DNA-binding response OmpR family regulator